MTTPNEPLPQTGQTGHAKETRIPYFEIAEDADGKFHWTLWSGNGRQLAVNATKYDRRKDAVAAIRAMVAAAGQANVIAKSHG